MVEHNEATLNDLEKEYCPPLDPALFTAIVFDYDIADSAQLKQLRETLDALKYSAWEQEDQPFDPSGTSGLNSSSGHDSDPSLSQADTNRSPGTDTTSEFSALSLSDRSRSTCPSRVSYIVGPDGTLSLSGATEEDKIYYLSEMFPTSERFTIEHTLRKSNGDVDRCMDVLLNFAFFEDGQPDPEEGKIYLPKGVDGFEDGDASRKKRGKRKGKNRNGKNRDAGSSDSPDSDFALPDSSNTINKWDAAQKDVDFICARTFPILKKETVTSTYHSNGASLSATIQALANSHAPKNRTAINENPVMAAQVDELAQDFPEIIPEILAGLLAITRNSISAAHEMAKAYMTVPAPRPAADLIKFTSTPPPLDIGEEAPKRRTATSSSSRDYEQVTAAAGYHYAAGTEALTKASAAYRRGKSDKLMGGAAAYYSAVGREHLERAKRNAAASADEFARRNATPNSIDLHGLPVHDAVRITSDHVSDWWESLGDSKYMRGSDGDAARGGYRIITGLGRHSHDGTSRLGPAVGKMLAREGWRVNVEPGVLTVIGVVRRR
ncbi:Smr domain protein [Aspergillus undulatus]|uniref:Smr domain protein n=1 Tax=Aspergillus undulatus TaxID=1810928 RepID=UPI003CCC97A2